MPRRKQQTAEARPEEWAREYGCADFWLDLGPTGEAQQDTPGVEGRACDDSRMRNRRGPTRWPTSGQTDSYKPRAKSRRAGRESEGFIVLTTLGETRDEGRGPASVALTLERKCGGMAERPNNPGFKAREAQGGLFTFAKSDGWTQGRVMPARTFGSDAPRGLAPVALASGACGVRRPLVSRVREIRTHGLKGGLRRGR